MPWKKTLSTLVCLSATTLLYSVATEAELDTALKGNDAIIDITSDIIFTKNPFPVNSTSTFVPVVPVFPGTTINGNGNSLIGGNAFRGFFVRGGSVTINNLTFSGTSQIGGRGGSGFCGGGGAAGFGGAVFVSDGTTVTLCNPTFQNSNATGGHGGTATSTGANGGGGGFGGRGGDALSSLAFSGAGGGGFSGNGGDAVSTFSGGGGGGGFSGKGGDSATAGTGDGGGGGGNPSTVGGSGGSGGGGGSLGGITPTGGDGGSLGASGAAGTLGTISNSAGGLGSGIPPVSGAGGGGGGSGDDGSDGAGNAGDGGDGGDGAGGGGGGHLGFNPASTGGDGGNGGIFGGGGASTVAVSNSAVAGDGGFAGGGGGLFIGTIPGAVNAGAGGFGGGGGAGSPVVGGIGAGPGGFGGGDGASADGVAAGGGGAGFGGAIFIERGGTLNLEGDVCFASSSVSGGAAGTGSVAVVTAPQAGQAAGVDIFMMSGSDLTFDITSDVLLQNPIEGNQGIETPGASVPTNTGGLTKKGPALLSLTGDNTYTGTTTVDAGELQINSSVVTNVVVEQGGKLSGNFDINVDASGGNGGNLTNSGTVCPGVTGIGTINLEGEYIQTASGRLIIDITPTGNINDKIMGATQATLAGTMEVVVNPGNYIAGTTYLVIDAPVTGIFLPVIETGGFGKLIDIDVTYSSVIITVNTTSLFEAQIIDSGPPSDVVKCIREANIVPDSDFALMVETLGILNNSQVNKALTSLSAVRYGALEWINARNNSLAADILSQHLFELCCSQRDCCSCDCNSNVWVTVFGNLMDNNKRLNNLRKYDADAVGVLAGMDWCCGDRFYYGAALGYTYTDLDWKNDGGRGKINSYYGALYGSWVCGCLSADLSVLGGGSDNDLKRKISFAKVKRTAQGDFWGYFVTGHLGLKTNWCWCSSTFEPFALADYHYYTHETFTEKGADSLNLRVRSKDQHMMRGEAGLLWYLETDCGDYCYAPYLGVSWVGEFPLNKSKQPASFTGQSCVIDALSYDSNVQLGAPQAGIKWTHCNGASLTLGYKGLFNKSTRINQMEGRLEWVF